MNDPMWYIEPDGSCDILLYMLYSRIEETLSDFLLNYGSRYMGHDGVASGYLTPTGFRRLTGCQ